MGNKLQHFEAFNSEDSAYMYTLRGAQGRVIMRHPHLWRILDALWTLLQKWPDKTFTLQ